MAYYRQGIPRKTQGWTLITHIITPLALLSLYILHFIVKKIWRCVRSGKPQKIEPVMLTTPAQNSKEKKREKIE